MADLDLQPPPHAVLSVIGYFFVAWSNLDFAMESAIRRLSGWSADEANRKLHRKTSGELKADLDRLVKRLDAPRRERLEAIIQNLNDPLELRKYMAHSLIMWSPGERCVVFRKTSDQSREDAQTVRLTKPEELRRMAAAVAQISHALMRAAGDPPAPATGASASGRAP